MFFVCFCYKVKELMKIFWGIYWKWCYYEYFIWLFFVCLYYWCDIGIWRYEIVFYNVGLVLIFNVMNLINFYGFLLSWLKEWEDWLGLLYLWFVNK